MNVRSVAALAVVVLAGLVRIRVFVSGIAFR